MKYSFFLFLQFFMLTTSFSNKVWLINKHSQIIELPYDLNTPVDHKEAYVFTMTKSHSGSIIYLVGAQSKPYQKIDAGTSAASALKKVYERVSRGFNLYFHRIMSDSTINTFADVQKWESVFDKIPRLYRVPTDVVVQIPLNTELVDNENAFVLHDGYAVTMYYSHLTNEKTKKLANSFVKYLVKFEKEKHNVDTPIHELHGEKTSNTVLEKFVKIIKKIVNTLSESKTNLLQENVVGNSESISEEFNAKIDITNDDEDEKFEIFTKDVLNYVEETLSKGAIDSVDYERILSSVTASTSSAYTSTARKNEVLNRKTIRKGKKKSFMKSKSANVPTTPIPSFMSKSTIITFGPPECYTEGKTLAQSIKSICVYIRHNFENSELFIYFGRDGIKHQYQVAVIIAESFLRVYPFMKVSYITDDGNLLPPSFII